MRNTLLDIPNQDLPYRWIVLALATLTNMFVTAVPSMAMPVLFDEVSRDLGLSLVQVGVVWGIGALPAIFSGLAGGALGDHYGPKRVLIAVCVACGSFGALRAAAVDFPSLVFTMVLVGLVNSMVTQNSLKMCSQWFTKQQLGLASGVLSMGMAAGFLLGSLLSATFLSPWLGGWRSVMVFYGVISASMALPWLLVRSHPGQPASADSTAPPARLPVRQEFHRLLRLRNIWLLGLGLLGIGGCVQGALGYLPLYLRGLDWTPANADSALASFHTVSMLFVVPTALLSDRLGSRRVVTILCGVMIFSGIGLLALGVDPLVWAAVLTAGMVRDGFMAVLMASIIETRGVGTTHAGVATGIVLIFSGLGNLLAPPLGNSLASVSPGLPFLFWAFLALCGCFSLFFLKEER